MKELLNLLLILETNVEESLIFKFHEIFSKVLSIITSKPTNQIPKDIKYAILNLEVLEIYSLEFTFDSECTSLNKPMVRIMFEILGIMNANVQKCFGFG